MAFFTNLLAILRKPAYTFIPLFPAAETLSWIPDVSSNIATQYATEAPLGRVTVPGTTFTFTSIPKFVVYNATVLKAGIDFTAGTTVTIPVALSVGDELYAIV